MNRPDRRDDRRPIEPVQKNRETVDRVIRDLPSARSSADVERIVSRIQGRRS